ncbi:MAG TPA: 23S rRNA (adenine(2030)-N(6))-methyltransferase RlmJ [Caulobacterales bacterium]|nr:23S rRNA (adenine(2030)-N(6))-methyltransferase RlmJ [Caulobacterales bacterium]
MNYRHAFHAGNHADVLKHLVLVFCLDALKRKPAPFAVLDTHAGPGLYDLHSEEAARSPEWRDGIARLWEWDAAPPLARAYVDAVRAANPDGALRFYPGSPALIAGALRDDDRLAACELHKDDALALKARFRAARNVETHARDGWEAMGALLPFPERRGLVLIDPPYEAPDELERAARALGPALRRFGHGLYLWWRPMKSESALAAADAETRAQGARASLRADLWVDTPTSEGKLSGSSMFLINPPYGLDEALRQTLPALSERLGVEGRGGWRVENY